jgi:2'-5' RNA ligase
MDYGKSTNLSETYNDFWEQFIRNDLKPASHEGGIGLGLIIWLKDSAIIEKIVEIQQTIAQSLSLVAIPRDSLHITVRNFGTMTEQPRGDLKVSPIQLPILLNHLQDILKDWPVFDATLRKVNSFSTAPFVEVYDGGVISGMRKAVEKLRDLGFGEYDYGPTGYVPHITLGYYEASHEKVKARKVVQALRDRMVGEIQVKKLILAKAFWTSGVYDLKSVNEFELKAVP